MTQFLDTDWLIGWLEEVVGGSLSGYVVECLTREEVAGG